MQLALYIIAGVIAAGSLGMLVYVYAKTLPKASALDLQAMPAHRQQQRKTSLVEDRLRRKTEGFQNSLRAFIKPIAMVFRKLFTSIYDRLVALEHSYREAAKGSAEVVESANSISNVATSVQAGQALLDEGKYVEAEKNFIAAIGVDPRSVDAYRGLARVYEAQNDLPHAVATWQFLMQLDPKDESIYVSLGTLLMQEKKYEDALEPFEQALELNPNNPKYLDSFIAVAILNGLKYKAQSTLDKLKAVNPENQKLENYQREIDQL